MAEQNLRRSSRHKRRASTTPLDLQPAALAGRAAPHPCRHGWRVEQITVSVGQQVTPCTNLARVADPTRLKAALRIAETQARDLRIVQLAEVDTAPASIKGKVIGIDPSRSRAL